MTGADSNPDRRRARENDATNVGRSFSRLTRPGEFRRVFASSLASADNCFRVLARLNHLEYSRLGMAVSRRVEPSAAGRNRIKRVIRESFRLYFPRGGPHFDLVVLPRRESASICNKQLFRSLDQHWRRILSRHERGNA